MAEAKSTRDKDNAIKDAIVDANANEEQAAKESGGQDLNSAAANAKGLTSDPDKGVVDPVVLPREQSEDTTGLPVIKVGPEQNRDGRTIDWRSEVTYGPYVKDFRREVDAVTQDVLYFISAVSPAAAATIRYHLQYDYRVAYFE